MVKRARALGMADARDVELREICLAWNPPLTVVTCDPDFRQAALRGGVAVLFFRPPETTARDRLREHFDAVLGLLHSGARLVTVPPEGPPVTG